MGEDLKEKHIIFEGDDVTTVVGAVRTNDDTARYEVQEATVGKYGRFSIDIYGDWTYILDNSNPKTHALSEGDRVQDIFPVTIKNSYGKVITTYVVIDILGRDEKSEPVKPAFVIEDDMAKGVVTEDEVLIAIGKLDTNRDDVVFDIQKGMKGSYGTFNITADGFWDYTLDNTSDIVQLLNDKDKRLDSFRVSARNLQDEIAFNEVTITVLGKDEEIPAEDEEFKII